jgi:hypothetical protein
VRPSTWLTLAMFFLLGSLVAFLMFLGKMVREASPPVPSSDIVCDYADRCGSAFTVGVRG